MRPEGPRQYKKARAQDVKPQPKGQPAGTDFEHEPALAVGRDGERNPQLGASAPGESGAAIGPPPGARILVDVNRLAGLDLKNQAVRAPENRPDAAALRPGLPAILRILARQPKRGCVAVVAEHWLVPSDHAVASHG